MVGLIRPEIESREVVNENVLEVTKIDAVPKLLINVMAMEEGWHEDPSKWPHKPVKLDYQSK